MMKRFMALMLTLVLVLSVAGCGKSSTTETTTGDTTKTDTTATDSKTDTTGTADPTAIDTSEHVVIKYMITGNKPTNGQNEELFKQINAILTEKVNAELEIYWIEWTDYLTNYNLTLAANDGSVDLVGTATDWLDAWPNAKRGAFLPLSEDMLATYAPQTYAQVSKEHWDMCKYDGQIFLMPEDNYAQWINHGFIYREDYAKEAGLANGVNSWEDLGTYFASVKANHPDVIPWDIAGTNGGAQTISGGWISSHTNNIMIEGLDVPIFWATQDDYYTVDAPVMTSDTFVDFAKQMKAWSDAGYWREDCLNYTGDSREEFLTGETSVDQHHTESWYGNDFIKMKERQPGVDIGFFYFGEETKNLVKMSITHGATAISAASKNPERALMVYDLLRNDQELHRLFNYGIEGKQYVITADGKMARPEGFNSDTDSIQTDFWWGRNDDLLLKDADRNNDAYQALTEEYNSFAIDYPYGQFIFNSEAVSPYIANLSAVYAQYLPLIAFGKGGDAEAIVAEFRQAMKDAGYEEVLAEVQRQMTEYKAYLGK